jgi:hypothetical protein
VNTLLVVESEVAFWYTVKVIYLDEFNATPVYWRVAHIDDICKNVYVFSGGVSSPPETSRNNDGAPRTAKQAGIGTPLFVDATLQDRITHSR